MLLKYEAEAKSLRLRLRPKGPEAKAKASYKAETEAKVLASRPVWLRGFDISDKFKYLEIIQPYLLCCNCVQVQWQASWPVQHRFPAAVHSRVSSISSAPASC